MKRTFRMGAGLLGIFLLLAGTALAAQPGSTFVVAPFSVQGPQDFAYLERSIPQMLNSRLYWKGRVEPARHELPAGAKPVSGESAADKLRNESKADYVIWGSVVVNGNDCSIDVLVRDKAGKTWPMAREAKAPQLINAITAISNDINHKVFGRTTTHAAVASPNADKGKSVNQMNPDLMVNETGPGEVYLNPHFRYAGTSSEDDVRLRSSPMQYSSVGMEVLDADGDGKNEIFVLSDHKLMAYNFNDGKMTPKGEYGFPVSNRTLSVRSLKHSGNKAWIIVNLVDNQGLPNSLILTYNGGSFSPVITNIRYYLNVANLLPNFRPTLIGQEAMPPRLFRPGVYEMEKQGDKLVPTRRVPLPDESINVFSFNYLPGGSKSDGDKLITLSNRENLRVYSAKGARLSESTEVFSGSAIGLEIDPSMPGLGRGDVDIASMFYIPMRLLTVDLERDGNWELLVNKPISTASQIFDLYRFYPQSEIHCLFWDGIGMNLQWKTRRIKGSMVDYTIADANNDGIMDLVVCLNTHPGALGVKARKTVVMLYPLDLNLTNPNTPADKSEVNE